MNVQSWILLAIVVVVFALVLRYIHRGGGKNACCKDFEKNCGAGSNTCGCGACNCHNR